MSKKAKAALDFYYEKYSSEDKSTREELGGHSEKEFVRFYDEDSLKPFFKAVKKKGNHYVSIYNDLILSGYNPKYVSVMAKKIDSYTGYERQNALCDVAGSRLANIFGIPTVYNFIFTETVLEDDLHYGYAEDTHMLSVDFAKFGEQMRTISDILHYPSASQWKELNINVSRDELFTDIDLHTWMQIFDNMHLMHTPIPKKLFAKSNIQKIKKDFIAMYFFRKYIIDDEDLEPRNVAIVYDENEGTMDLAPSHDYDFSFKGLSHTAYKHFSEEDMKYCMQHYPAEMDAIMKSYAKIEAKYSQFFDEKNKLSICKNQCELYTTMKNDLQDQYAASDMCETVMRNLRRLAQSYKSLLSMNKNGDDVDVM